MSYNLFVDSDTILDFLLDREPFAEYSEVILNRGKQGILKTNTSALILANIHYVVAKNVNRHFANEAIKEVLTLIRVLPFEEDDITHAIDAGHIDFEDSIQYFIAKKSNCDMIISRNLKHYKKFDLPVLTAEQFLRTKL